MEVDGGEVEGEEGDVENVNTLVCSNVSHHNTCIITNRVDSNIIICES